MRRSGETPVFFQWSEPTHTSVTINPLYFAFSFPQNLIAVILRLMHEVSYVYILASGFKHLYIGVTTELEVRILQHKNKAFPDSFTARYNIKDLVYFERFRRPPFRHYP